MPGELYINGTRMPDPMLEGLTVSREKIWSSNTGRVASAKMVGTLVAIKTTLKIRWPPLTPAQLSTIESAVCNASNPFVTVRFTNPANPTGALLEKTMYFGTLTYSAYSFSAGARLITNASIDAIEQ